MFAGAFAIGITVAVREKELIVLHPGSVLLTILT